MPKIETITKDDALILLASAVSYCQQAGIEVRAANNAGCLWLGLNGIELINTETGKPGYRQITSTGNGRES